MTPPKVRLLRRPRDLPSELVETDPAVWIGAKG